ncbi:MAG: hypothetical protein IJD36_03255, partial [Clostridia bacterium]|nr:hypothetical protein [Clostridia bacterium]
VSIVALAAVALSQLSIENGESRGLGIHFLQALGLHIKALDGSAFKALAVGLTCGTGLSSALLAV